MAPSSSLLLSPKGTTAGSPATFPTEFSKGGDIPIPYLNLPQPALLRYSNFKPSEQEDEHTKLVVALAGLSARVDHLNSCELEVGYSETLQACRVSLQSRVPFVLGQLKQLIDSQKSPLGSKLRSKLALYRAVQYVDRIQEGMDPETNEGLDQQLRSVLSGLDMSTLPNDFKKNLTFRVSPWVPTALCFDLPLGESARATCDDAFDIVVEPVVEFRTDDRTSVSYAHFAARACQVTIEKVSHSRCQCLGAGMIGEATIRVRVAPMDDAAKQLRAWDAQTDAQSLHIQEARVVQLNAYPPKPKANVDIYTSYVYGDTGVTITMVIKTCATGDSADTPKLHAELFMAPVHGI